jgi:organic radical activating enzyme
MSRRVISKGEFYITNVCNLTCENCNRFNDYNFKGWQAWNDYKDDYTEWAKYVDFEHIVILGGEPLLNPTIVDWALGLNALWPTATVQILTNGTRLTHVKDLYEKIKNRRIWIGVSLHNDEDNREIFEQIENFVRAPVKEMHGKENNIYNADWYYEDSNRIKVAVWNQTEFYQSSIKRNAAGELTLHNSDPLKAHSNCGFVHWKNYHFIRGKMYKCGPSTLLPEFDQQHPLAITAEDRKLLYSYRPLGSDELAIRLDQFMDEIDNPIPMCKFCPEQSNYKKIWAIRKGK